MVVPLMNRIDVKRIVVLILLMQAALVSFAQMSDEQVVSMLKEARDQGKSQEEMIVLLSQRGVTREQLERIRANYTENTREEVEASGTTDRARTEVPVEATAPQRGTAAVDRVFGREVFNSELLTFEPNLNIATPNDYVLGPGDEVIIDIWGDSKQTLRQQIAPDGTITDPQMGPIVLNGLSVEEANARLSNAYSRIYSTMNGASPTTYMKMSLGEIRSIRVNIMGEVVVPGTYTLSAFASVFHALYNAGGISDLGSLRDIKVVRNGKTVANVDVYEYILQGKTEGNINLREGDVVIVPTYDAIVKMEGNVKRPMRYEMKSTETISTLLKYAGFFSANAYKNSVRVVRQEGRELSVATVERDDFGTFKVMDGDVVSADSIINRFANKLEIQGAVYRPGIYEFCENINSVKELLTQADGLLGDAFTNRAVIYRQRPNLTREVLPVDVKGIMDGTAADVELKNNDLLFVPSIHDIKYEGDVYISGEVKRPGTYPYADNMTLEDFVITAGGLNDAASLVRVDVSRRIKDNKGTESTAEVSKNFTFGLKDGFIVDGQAGFVLEPYDQVFVRRSPGYSVQRNVTVDGEVLFAGEYSLNMKNERLSSLIERAGGVTEFGYTKGAKLTRVANDDERKRMNDVLDLMRRELGEKLTDSLRLELDSVFTVGIDLEAALKNPGGDADIVLREGDVISVPEMTSTVKINGAVMMPNTVTYIEGKNVGYYLSQAGGYSQNAKKSKKFIIYMNGQVDKVKSRSHKVEPGCEIVVPNKVKKNTFANVMGYTTSFASLAMMVATIANLIK